MQRSTVGSLVQAELRHIADYVSNFIAMATRDGRGGIRLALSNSPFSIPPPPLIRHKDLEDISYTLYKPSYSPFCLRFRCHGNRGQPRVNTKKGEGKVEGCFTAAKGKEK